MKTATALLAIALLACSCATLQSVHSDARAEYVAAAKAFAATVDALAAMREQGKFSVETADRITIVIGEGRKYLQQWRLAVEVGDDTTAPRTQFASVLVALDKLRSGT